MTMNNPDPHPSAGPYAEASPPARDESTVDITCFVERPPETVWQALVNPDCISRWFAEASAAPRPGQRTRFEFGDGDFFTVEVREVVPLERLRYVWRFMGIGPREEITWHLSASGGGCTVRVVDRNPGRSAEEARELHAGWTDFTQRLLGFQHTGHTTRYDWRREIDVSVELAGSLGAARRVLFERPLEAAWLPFTGQALRPGGEITVADGRDPQRLQLVAVLRESGERLRLRLGHPRWRRPTECVLDLASRRPGTVLSVHHLGWEAIGDDADEPKRQRRRFADLWVAALQRARAAVEEPGGSPRSDSQPQAAIE